MQQRITQARQPAGTPTGPATYTPSPTHPTPQDHNTNRRGRHTTRVRRRSKRPAAPNPLPHHLPVSEPPARPSTVSFRVDAVPRPRVPVFGATQRSRTRGGGRRRVWCGSKAQAARRHPQPGPVEWAGRLAGDRSHPGRNTPANLGRTRSLPTAGHSRGTSQVRPQAVGGTRDARLSEVHPAYADTQVVIRCVRTLRPLRD